MIVCADVLEGLAALPDASFDACLTDPPYGIRFMGRKWDHGVPSAAVWAEVFRVLRPGAFLFAFGGTRSFHRLACAIEDAGFEIRDSVGIAWGYGSGFPKSLDIGKAIDRAAGAEREVVGPNPTYRKDQDAAPSWTLQRNPNLTAPATPAACTWSGYGTALAPSWEPVVVAMKPLGGTFAQNAVEFGVAGLNVDGGRIGNQAGWSYPKGRGGRGWGGRESLSKNLATPMESSTGRWPKNAVLVHDARCRRVGTRRVSGGVWPARRGGGGIGTSGRGGQAGLQEHSGPEVIESWECVAECPVAALDAQAGELNSNSGEPFDRNADRFRSTYNAYSGARAETGYYGDSGPASRFFFQAGWHDADFWPLRYVAKAATEERERGLRGVLPCVVCGGVSTKTHRDEHGREQPCRRCDHPTIKPLELTKYLSTLLLPPRRESGPRRLLVPFSGAGSEVIGATLAGWEQVVGIDASPWYCRLALARIAAADWRKILERPVELAPIIGSLFGAARPSESEE